MGLTSISGERCLPIPATFREVIQDGVASELRTAGALAIERQGSVLEFHGSSVWIGPTGDWGPFANVEDASIEVTGDANVCIRYRFSIRRYLTKVALLVIVPHLIALAVLRTWLVVKWLPLLFIWMVGGSYLLYWFYLDRFVRKSAAMNGIGSQRCPHCGLLYEPEEYVEGAVPRCVRCGEEVQGSSSSI